MPKFVYEDGSLFPDSNLGSEPRILKLADQDAKPNSCVQPRHCDLVVTVLRKLTDHPDAVELFFDPSVSKFDCYQYYDDDKKGDLWLLFISRHDTKVFSGLYRVSNNDERVPWRLLRFSDMSEISFGAEWEGSWAAHEAYTDTPATEVRKHPDNFSDINFKHEGRDLEDLKEAVEIVEKFCTELLKYEMWKRPDITSDMDFDNGWLVD